MTMPPSPGIEATGLPERRAHKRTRVNKRCRIVIGNNSYETVAKNLTVRGACLDLPRTIEIAQAFELTFDCGRTFRRCAVVWRGRNSVGVTFVTDEH
jgi:hypothetical protein